MIYHNNLKFRAPDISEILVIRGFFCLKIKLGKYSNLF